MKSYNHLYEKMFDYDNYEASIRSASRGKRSRKSFQRFLDSAESSLGYITRYIENYKPEKHEPVIIYDGIQRKKRTIIVPRNKEQIMHHMMVRSSLCFLKPGMYEHSYGSIPKRGPHKGKKVIEKWISKDRDNTQYCLKMDIQKYFDSIPHDILKDKLKKVIHDSKFLDLWYKTIDVTEVGIPLGFYTSQWLANWYLQDLDHWIKEVLRAKYYIRYMDDMVIFGPSKEELHEMRKKISDKLNKDFGLNLKYNWQVFKFDYINDGKHYGRDLDFMGFRFFCNKTILRKSILMKARRKAMRMSKKEKHTVFEARQVIAYLGWIDATDTYDYCLDYIKPYIDYQYCKRRVSNYDRRKAREQNEANRRKQSEARKR